MKAEVYMAWSLSALCIFPSADEEAVTAHGAVVVTELYA